MWLGRLLAREELDGYDGIKPDQTESNLCRDLGLAGYMIMLSRILMFSLAF